MNFKKLVKALLFPHIAVMIILIPTAAAFLVYSLSILSPESVIAIISYVLSAYTLTVWCFRIPELIGFFKAFKSENKYIKLWQSNADLRMKVSLYGTVILNTAYAVFQLCLGFWHRSFWFFSLAGYYISLGIMRFFLVRHTSRYKPRENMYKELIKYRACGIIFLIMNLALALIIFFMIYWNRTFNHHEITTIAMAAYTFTAFTVAIVNAVKYRRIGSPVYSASKAINLASACVSMLTLESTMLTTFGKENLSLFDRRMMLGASGGVISVFIIVMAIFMIATGTKKIKLLKPQRSK